VTFRPPPGFGGSRNVQRFAIGCGGRIFTPTWNPRRVAVRATSFHRMSDVRSGTRASTARRLAYEAASERRASYCTGSFAGAVH
jgi:hypothetical protein